MKRFISLLLSLFLILSLTACAAPASEPDVPARESVSTPAPEEEVSPVVTEPVDIAVEKTAVQSQPDRYVPIADVGSYNAEIITDEILQGCTLPTLDKAALPYWTGCILENKCSVNSVASDEWENYNGGACCFSEAEIRYLADQGFNCVRALYSLSFLSNPENVDEINVAELEQLDELIAWCAKYDMHLILAQTGLPGKWASWGDNRQNDFDAWNNDENVGGNPELFTSEEMQSTYLAYYGMLAKRYRDIPNGILSFELATEAQVPEQNGLSMSAVQAQVLGPVAQTIWSYTPDRIVIANDIAKQVPAEMAALGCCISLHDHFYSLGDADSISWTGFPNVEQSWPMQYLPGVVDEHSGALSLASESGFTAGMLELYFEYHNLYPVVEIDGNVVYRPENGEPVYQPSSLAIDIPDGAMLVEITFPSEAGFLGFVLEQEGKATLTLPSHAIGQCLPSGQPMPSLLIHDDMSVEDISKTKYSLDVAYFTEHYLKPFLDCAKANGVSFLMTEVGTDQAAHLSPEEYFAYESTWLQALKAANTGWMYNCLHNILAPEQMMWLNANNTQFTQFSEVPDMYGYMVNNTVMNMLKAYQ